MTVWVLKADFNGDQDSDEYGPWPGGEFLEPASYIAGVYTTRAQAKTERDRLEGLNPGSEGEEYGTWVFEIQPFALDQPGLDTPFKSKNDDDEDEDSEEDED